MEHKTVIIIGAGPVGLLIAIRLGQAGIPTLVLEKHRGLPYTTRASVYQPIVLRAFREIGILDLIKSHAFLNHEGIFWRDMSGAELGHLPVSDEECILLIGQARMNDLFLRELEKYPSVEVRFQHQLVGIEQDLEQNKVKIMVREPVASSDDITFSADWLLGTDGANSSVRHCLCIPFEGYSHTKFRMIGADVYYDFIKENNWSLVNFMVDPADWAVVTYTGQDQNGDPYGDASPLWRIAYSEPTELDGSPEKIMERAKKRIAHYAKGKEDLEIARAEPYIVHQRCAAQARKERVLLAGDALHSNNPMGGLGLTTGILDAFAYGNALVRVISGGEDPALLTDCANARRTAWLKTTNPFSMTNLKRMASVEEEDVRARERFFERLRTDKDFPMKIRAEMDEMLTETFQ